MAYLPDAFNLILPLPLPLPGHCTLRCVCVCAHITHTTRGLQQLGSQHAHWSVSNVKRLMEKAPSQGKEWRTGNGPMAINIFKLRWAEHTHCSPRRSPMLDASSIVLAVQLTGCSPCSSWLLSHWRCGPSGVLAKVYIWFLLVVVFVVVAAFYTTQLEVNCAWCVLLACCCCCCCCQVLLRAETITMTILEFVACLPRTESSSLCGGHFHCFSIAVAARLNPSTPFKLHKLGSGLWPGPARQNSAQNKLFFVLSSSFFYICVRTSSHVCCQLNFWIMQNFWGFKSSALISIPKLAIWKIDNNFSKPKNGTGRAAANKTNCQFIKWKFSPGLGRSGSLMDAKSLINKKLAELCCLLCGVRRIEKSQKWRPNMLGITWVALSSQRTNGGRKHARRYFSEIPCKKWTWFVDKREF